MAVEATFIRSLRGLDPADDAAWEALRNWKIGAEIKGKFNVTHDPNPQRRYFFGMVQLVIDNTELFGSKDEAEDSIKLSVGHVDICQEYVNGQWHIRRTPKTVAGKAIPTEAEWRDFNRRVEKLICEVLCVSEAQLADAMTNYLAPQLNRSGSEPKRKKAGVAA